VYSPSFAVPSSSPGQTAVAIHLLLIVTDIRQPSPLQPSVQLVTRLFKHDTSEPPRFVEGAEAAGVEAEAVIHGGRRGGGSGDPLEAEAAPAEIRGEEKRPYLPFFH
jgi:hypothetical protein